MNTTNPNVCWAPRCARTDIDIIFHLQPVCLRCWLKLEDMGLEAFKDWLGIPNNTDRSPTPRTPNYRKRKK